MDSRCGCSWSTTTRSSAERCASPVRARATPSRRRSAPPRRSRASRSSIRTSSILDLMLPDLSGFDVCREIRRAGHRMPVIILSAKHDEIDVVLGLEIGADDYIAKPFRPRELLARIGAHLRRAKELRGEDKPARRAPRLPRPRHRHGRAPGHARRPGHRPHPHRVRPALVPRVERRQGALPRTDPQRRLGVRAPDRDAGDRRPRAQSAAQDRTGPGRSRATSSPSRASDTASRACAADRRVADVGRPQSTLGIVRTPPMLDPREPEPPAAAAPTPCPRSPSVRSPSSRSRCSPPRCWRRTPTPRRTSSCRS